MDITKNYLTPEEERYLRVAYYGGRVEIYQTIGKNLNYYDVNSLYPTVMQQELYPIGKMIKQNGNNLIKGHKQIEFYIKTGYLGIVKANIYYPYRLICCLPVRNKDRGTIYPYGHIQGLYTSVELQEAEREGAKIEYIEGYFWQKKRRIFKQFVDNFYKLKSESKGAKREVAKLFLNTSYGKFGQRRNQSEVMRESEIVKKDIDINQFELLGSEDNKDNFYSRNKETYKNRNINPIYAIFITAYARLYLFRIMKEIGFENCYYCDTDSILTDKELPPYLVDDKALGKLKKEYPKVLEGYFVSPKLYGLKIEKDYDEREFEKIKDKVNIQANGSLMNFDIIKAKGVTKKFIKKMSLDKFKNLVETKTFKYKTIDMVSFKQKFKLLGLEDKDSFVNTMEHPKEFSCEYSKRIIKGNKTYPIEIL